MIKAQHLHKNFGSKAILADINLSCAGGEFISLFGPNGCGKSTLVKILTGQLQPSSGQFELAAENIGYVFQNYRETLLPWKTPLENVVFPLTIRGESIDSGQAKLTELLQQLELEFPAVTQTNALSGGQAQLLCLLRALITEPDLLILDEPFAALDYHRAAHIREKLYNYVKSQGITTLMITHRLEDAIYMSDRVYFLGGPPTKIHYELLINLPLARSLETLISPAFIDLRQAAIGQIQT